MFKFIKANLLYDVVDPHTTKRTILQLLIICVSTICVYLNIFQNTFANDDIYIFLNWPAVQKMQIVKLLQGNYPPAFEGKRVYRPVKAVLLSVEQQFFKTDPFYYQIQAILLNLSITLLIFFIIKSITKKSSIAFVSSLLFGIHPIHTEAITFLTASLDTWGILFFFLSFYFYIKEGKNKLFYLSSLFFAFLAFFTYELTVTLPLVLILYDLCFRRINRQNLRKKILDYIPYFFLIACFLILSFHFIGSYRTTPYFANSFYLTMLTMTKAIVRYLQLFILPLNQSFNTVLPGGIDSIIYDISNLEPIISQSIFNPYILFSITLIISLICIGLIFLKKGESIFSFLIFFFFLTLLPVLNLIPINTIFAERYDYIPSFAAAILAGVIFNFLYRRKYNKPLRDHFIQNLLIIFLILITIIFSILTLKRNTNWKDDLAIGENIASQATQEPLKSFYQGLKYYRKDDFQNAIIYFNETIKKQNNYRFAYYYLTTSYIKMGDYKMARKTFDVLAKISPSDSKSIKNLESRLELAGSDTLIGNNLKEFSTDKFSFIYPSDWISQSYEKNVIVQNKNLNFWVLINYSTLSKETSFDKYIKGQNKTYGELVKSQPIQQPNSDYAYGRVWRNLNILRLQFFIFKGNSVLEVLAWPADSAEMTTFYNLLSSVKLR